MIVTSEHRYISIMLAVANSCYVYMRDSRVNMYRFYADFVVLLHKYRKTMHLTCEGNPALFEHCPYMYSFGATIVCPWFEAQSCQ